MPSSARHGRRSHAGHLGRLTAHRVRREVLPGLEPFGCAVAPQRRDVWDDAIQECLRLHLQREVPSVRETQESSARGTRRVLTKATSSPDPPLSVPCWSERGIPGHRSGPAGSSPRPRSGPPRRCSRPGHAGAAAPAGPARSRFSRDRKKRSMTVPPPGKQRYRMMKSLRTSTSVCPSSVPVGRGCLRQHPCQVPLEARFLGEVDSWRLSAELRMRMYGRSSMVASQSLLDQCLRQPGLLPEPADPFREQVQPGGGVRLAPVSDQSAEEHCPGR